MDSLYNLAVIVSVVDRLTGPVQKMAQAVANFENTVQKARGMVDFGQRLAVSGALVQGAADKMTRVLAKLLGPTVENQRALGELASVGIKNMDALTRAARRFSAEWAGTTEAQFLSAAYDIKSGIASLTDEGVAEFTRMAALTAKATKSTTAEMTSLFATGYGIFKDLYGHLSDFEFGEMFSAGIAAAVQQFKTTGSGMAQALTTLGATAATAQRPFEEQLAVLGMLQATMPGSEAGTKYKAFVQAAAKAGEKLGLSFVDANGQLLGIVGILDKLRGKYGETLDAMEKQKIQEAFGRDEAVAVIDLLYGKVGQLRGNIDQLGITVRQGTAFTEDMARKMNTDLGASLAVLGQQIDITKGIIGDELAPLIKAFIPTVKGWVTSFQELTKSHPTLTRTALLIAAIGTAALMVIAPILTVGAGLIMLGGYLAWSFAWMGKGVKWTQAFTSALFKFGRAAISVGVRALVSLTSVVWSFTASLLACPITWIVLAVVGLGVAIWALARNWDKVTAWLGARWEWVKNRFDGAKEWIAGVFSSITARAREYAPYILAAVMPVVGIPLLIWRNWDRIKEFVGQALTNAVLYIRTKAMEFLASGRALIQAFVDGIKSVINKPAEIVKAGLLKLRRLLPFSDAKEGPLSTLTYSGMALVNTFAAGIRLRAPYLQAVAAATLGGIALPEARGFGAWSTSPLGRTPAVSLREVMRETSRERESVFTRDRRPIVVLVNGGQKQSGGFEEYVDLALRYLDMQGD
jgi:TP901 family phage tail tape measure protein